MDEILKLIKINKLEMRQTKTQDKYITPCMQLIIKKPRQDIQLKENAYVPIEFIELQEKILWKDYKKTLEIVGDKVVDKSTGEIVETVHIIQKDKSMEVKFL